MAGLFPDFFNSPHFFKNEGEWSIKTSETHEFKSGFFNLKKQKSVTENVYNPNDVEEYFNLIVHPKSVERFFYIYDDSHSQRIQMSAELDNCKIGVIGSNKKFHAEFFQPFHKFTVSVNQGKKAGLSLLAHGGVGDDFWLLRITLQQAEFDALNSTNNIETMSIRFSLNKKDSKKFWVENQSYRTFLLDIAFLDEIANYEKVPQTFIEAHFFDFDKPKGMAGKLEEMTWRQK